jgi:pantothenate synthetase
VRTADRLDRPSDTDVDLVVLTAGRLGKARLIDNLQCRAPVRK